jgi:5-formyltetrahydrofolate cyclo-ligase
VPSPELARPDALRSAKAAARRAGREAILALGFAERAGRSLEIFRRILELPEYQAARRVLAYASLPDEVATGELLAAMLEAGREVSLPAAENGRFSLAVRRIADPARDLMPGPFGVPVPLLSCPPADLARIELIFVPGRAFDRRGGRVGRGIGYYDRLLSRRELARARTFGLAFDCQIRAAPVPGDERDVPLCGLVTESEIIRSAENPKN